MQFDSNAGLMWESAPAFNALLVFAEHRYYGHSKPFGSRKELLNNMQYLTSEQVRQTLLIAVLLGCHSL